MKIPAKMKKKMSDGSYENTGRIDNHISDDSYEDTDDPVSSDGTETVEITPTDDEDSSQEDHSSSTEIEESPAQTTRAGRATRHTSKGWYKDFAILALEKAEIVYQNHLKEVVMLNMTHEDYKIHHEAAFVGAGLGGGFKSTAELKVVNYTEAMRSDRIGWTMAVEEEYKRMISNKVWSPIKIVNVPKGAKMLTSTWAMKKKSNGRLRARINGRGYEQIDGIQYESNSIRAPVTNDTTVRVMMVLALMAGWL